ncbi:MAG: M48 family metallopeptidase, partial [Clostridiales bacterium]|nr:M48 family metallopeptidase [Clostridiales bacterium]
KHDIAHMVQKHAGWIESHLEKQRRRAEARPELSKDEQEALRKQAKAVIPLKVAHYSRLMGLTPLGITITSAEKRFGSCSAKNRLCFSWRLMRYPDAAIDYVVVHELAHIMHKNHGKAFYALIESYMPDYKERKRLLKG